MLLPRRENCRACSDIGSSSQGEIILALSPFAVASRKSQLCHRAAQRAHLPDAGRSKPKGDFNVCQAVLGVASADGRRQKAMSVRATIFGWKRPFKGWPSVYWGTY